jgi:hypothetical protein
VAGLLIFCLASTLAAEPEIVVMTFQKSGYFVLREAGFKVFYNKYESKYIPVGHYDFLANGRFEVMHALTDDKRARWREATPEDGLDFATLWDAKKPVLPANLKADGVLLIFFSEFGAGFGGDAFVGGWMKLLDKHGKQVWKEDFIQKDSVEKKVPEWIGEDPAALRTLINGLQEQAVADAVKKIAKKKVTP